ADWTSQHSYLRAAHNVSSLAASSFLALNVVAMLLGSALALARVRVGVAAMLLAGVLVTQAAAFAQFRDIPQMLRAAAIAGGLLILAADGDGVAPHSSCNGTPAAEADGDGRHGRVVLSRLPPLLADAGGSDRQQWRRAATAAGVRLFGRVLLVGMVGRVALSVGGTAVAAAGLSGCAAVAIGFRARVAGAALLAGLAVANFALHGGWWFLERDHPNFDYVRYDFFQTLSVLGGLLLFVARGPGRFSLDESFKKKQF
ncbi:hypothetical protein HK405_003025, partial [Cladochytrium tenue]